MLEDTNSLGAAHFVYVNGDVRLKQPLNFRASYVEKYVKGNFKEQRNTKEDS